MLPPTRTVCVEDGTGTASVETGVGSWVRGSLEDAGDGDGEVPCLSG